MLCARVSLWIKNIPSDVRLIFLARRSSLLSVLFTYPVFSKKSVMRVILVLVNYSFWLISEGDRQWFSAANNVVRTIYAEWFIPYAPRNSDILSCILLFVRIQSCINKCSRKGYAGSLFFWCLIIFSNVSVLFISLFSILLKHTVCVQARISHPVNIDFPLQFIPTWFLYDRVVPTGRRINSRR